MDAYLLIQLATKIDEARIVANVIPATASQSDGVYGQLVESLMTVLTLIVGKRANNAYACILDGDTVEQAIKNPAISS